MSAGARLPLGIDGTGIAHPEGYTFFVSLMVSVFMGFVVAVLAAPSLRDREAGILAIGFLLGGLVFSWLSGAFDVKHGWFAVAGHALGMAGLGYLFFREGNDLGRP